MARNQFPKPRPALEFLMLRYRLETEECFKLPNDQKRVYYLNSQRTPQWVSTCMEYGPPGVGEVPVRTCQTRGCKNGKHHRWGGQEEANATRLMPSYAGGDNPNSKLSALEVSQLRSVKWYGGYYKRHAAEAAGISMRTLANMLNGHTWKGMMPYRGAAEWAARSGGEDEF